MCRKNPVQCYFNTLGRTLHRKKILVQFCLRSSRQDCTRKSPVQCCLSTPRITLHRKPRQYYTRKNPFQYCLKNPMQCCLRGSRQCFFNVLLILSRQYWTSENLVLCYPRDSRQHCTGKDPCNVSLILLRQRCPGKNLVKCCPRGSRQH